MIKRGYFHAGNISHNQDSLKEYLKFSHQLPGIFSKKNISIELHHRITLTNFSEECPLKDTILKNFRSKKFRDHNLKIPNENDLLLTQLINLTKYPEFKLGALTIFDYSVLNKNYNFDYINLLKAVKNLKARRSLTLATLICDLILNSYENSKGKNADLLNLVEDEIVSIAISRLYQIPGNNIIKNNLPFYLIQNKHFKELIFLFFRKVFPDRRLINYRYGEKSIKFLTKPFRNLFKTRHILRKSIENRLNPY